MQHHQLLQRGYVSSTLVRPLFAVALAFASAFPAVVSAEEATVQAAPGTAPELRDASKRKLVEDLLATQRAYDCCSETLKTCLQKSPVCPLVARLHRAIARMAADGMSRAQIEVALAQRKATMRTDQPAVSIVVDEQLRAGNRKAPVTLAIYACPRNESCARLIPDVYREITTGRLKDKATLVYRPFFPAGDREALECGRGLYAAAYQGQFWPYLVHLCLERDHLTQATIRDWASSHGLDRCIFDQTCEQASTADWLQASRREGLANGVTSAPAVFIDGRRVQGPLDLQTLVDLAEEEHARLTALVQVPGRRP